MTEDVSVASFSELRLQAKRNIGADRFSVFQLLVSLN